jgi:hypothetical protein
MRTRHKVLIELCVINNLKFKQTYPRKTPKRINENEFQFEIKICFERARVIIYFEIAVIHTASQKSEVQSIHNNSFAIYAVWK